MPPTDFPALPLNNGECCRHLRPGGSAVACYSQYMKLGVMEYVDCAHFLPNHPKCGPLHGHTYKVELVVEGQPKSGMIIDFGDLKQALREALAPYDHRSWND